MKDLRSRHAPVTPDNRVRAAMMALALMPFAVSLSGLGDYMVLFLILGFVGLLVLAAGWKSFSMNKRMIGVGVVGLFLALALIPALTANVGPAGGGPPGSYTPQWEILIPSTIQGTPRDVASEIFDTNGGTGGGGETPTATLCVFATNCFADRTNKLFRVGITRNTALATSAAGFQAPDIFSADLSIRLINPQDANGDGVMDSVSFFGRIRSVSATVTQDGNQTVQRNIFMRDQTFGWYIGWSRRVDTQATDGMWISACPPGQYDAQMPTSPAAGCLDWQNLGSTAGADEDYITFAYVARNYGFYGYTLPPNGYTYTVVLDIGTPANYVTYSVQVFLSSG